VVRLGRVVIFVFVGNTDSTGATFLAGVESGNGNKGGLFVPHPISGRYILDDLDNK
jgi:type IV secretory pathway VirB9-like protein